MIKVALIVGHEVNSENQGAVNYLGETESSFNMRICEKIEYFMLMNYEGVYAPKIFLRDGKGRAGVAQAVADFKPDISIEFHFNSFPKPIRGCEALALWDDNLSIYFADLITNVLYKELKIPQRRDSGVFAVRMGDDGYLNLRLIDRRSEDRFPKILLEPVFANTKNEDAVKIFENEDSYVNCILIALNEHFKIHEKEKDYIVDVVECSKKGELVHVSEKNYSIFTRLFKLVRSWFRY